MEQFCQGLIALSQEKNTSLAFQSKAWEKQQNKIEKIAATNAAKTMEKEAKALKRDRFSNEEATVREAKKKATKQRKYENCNKVKKHKRQRVQEQKLVSQNDPIYLSIFHLSYSLSNYSLLTGLEV